MIRSDPSGMMVQDKLSSEQQHDCLRSDSRRHDYIIGRVTGEGALARVERVEFFEHRLEDAQFGR